MATSKTEILTAVQVNAATGEQIIRPLTDEELADLERVRAEIAAEKAAEAAKAAARQSALAKLAELGLTEEEIAAL